MTTQTVSDGKQGTVREMREIRDQISREIENMTFDEERAYLDKLLAETKPDSARREYKNTGVDVND